MKSALALLTIFSGMLLPLQAGINAQTGRALGHPVWGVVTNFVIGLLACLAALLAIRPNGAAAPDTARMISAPWWVWTGGLCGAAMVFIALYTVPKLGFVGLLAGLIAGQLIASVALDHFGILRDSPHPLTLGRMLGVGLLVAGFVLVNRE